MDAFKKVGVRFGLFLVAAIALANTGCMLVVGAAAGGAAGAAGYSYYKDKKDSDSSSASAAVVHNEPPLAPSPSSAP